MRIPSLLFVLTVLAMQIPANAECSQHIVMKPVSGKTGFQMEIWLTNADGAAGKVEIRRPMSDVPSRYTLVAEDGDTTGTRFVILGDYVRRVIEIRPDGTAVMTASREFPSQWQTVSC